MSVARAAHELGVGPQHPEGLVDDVALPGFHDDGVDLKVLAPGLLARGRCRVLGYLAQERHGKSLDILAATHPRVVGLHHVDHPEGDGQSKQERHQQYVAGVG